VCFFVLCNRHWFNKTPGPDSRGTELGVTYLPSAFSSDANCANLPTVIGCPSQHRGSGETWVTVSCEARPRLIKPPSPGQDHMYPFGLTVIGAAPRYIPAGAVIELWIFGIRQVVHHYNYVCTRLV